MEPDDPTADGEVLLSESIGRVRVLTLNRPRARNSLNPDLKDAILQAMAEADGDPDVRAVVITGNGPVFCAGMDLKAFAGGAAFGGWPTSTKPASASPSSPPSTAPRSAAVPPSRPGSRSRSRSSRA